MSIENQIASPKVQKTTAVVLGAIGAIGIIGVRIYADRNPGPNLAAFCILLMGIGCAAFGLMWYFAARKAEETT